MRRAVAVLVAALWAGAAAAEGLQARLDALGVPLALPEGRAIVVNVPGFELVAVEDGDEVLRSRVIVGAPWHRTPVRATYARGVTFRPTWRPTPAMVASGEYANRVWPAGPSNPLGLAAVRLEPGFLVYLHDTNHRELFARENRALSHGCIRVERWDELVAWLLGIDLAAVHALAEGGRTVEVPVDPVPVMLGYYLVFPGPDGAAVEHADLYGRGGSVATDWKPLPGETAPGPEAGPPLAACGATAG